MMKAHRNQALWYAFALHRVSGLLLALFLPVHFLVLSQAVTAPEALDGFLAWSQRPVVKAAEFALVFLLAVHLFGGLRLMALEALPWRPHQKTYAALALSGAFAASVIFLLSAAS